MAAIPKFIRRETGSPTEDFVQRIRLGAVGAGILLVLIWVVKWIC